MPAFRPQLRDVKVEYHPSSRRQPEIFQLHEYSAREFQRNEVPLNDSPWRPFRTRLDFEAAELALATSMNRDHTNQLCDLFHSASAGNGLFTLGNYDEVVKMWDLASYKCTGVRQSVIVF